MFTSSSRPQPVDSTSGRLAEPKDCGADGQCTLQTDMAENLLLQELLATDGAYPGAFTYSVLQILPKTAALAETVEWERLLQTEAWQYGYGAERELTRWAAEQVVGRSADSGFLTPSFASTLFIIPAPGQLFRYAGVLSLP